jgi:hypothetical protein
MERKLFSINGYWKDNKEEFTDYTVADTDDFFEEDEDDIFFYGLTENHLKEAVEKGDSYTDILDFVITSYKTKET